MSVLESLRGGLIVSVQAPRGSALDDPQVIAAMARAAVEAGAVGVRIESIAHLEAVRASLAASASAASTSLDVPIIGLVKREYAGFAPYITPTLDDVREVARTGVAIVAFDATERPRPDGSTIAATIEEIHRAGALAMADCATVADGQGARDAGADILATTLCGYTEETRGTPLPALSLVRDLTKVGGFVICEGGIRTPESGRAARDAGAEAIVVGTAITGVGCLTHAFADALRRGHM